MNRELYPGQAYFHQVNSNIRRSEENWSGKMDSNDNPRTIADPIEDWRHKSIGEWFFMDSPECTSRFAVMERTESGYTLVCSTPWHYDQARQNMIDIALRHNEALPRALR